jgi:hypothetical protein
MDEHKEPKWICDWCWRWNNHCDIYCARCGRDIMVSSIKAARIRKHIKRLNRGAKLRVVK